MSDSNSRILDRVVPAGLAFAMAVVLLYGIWVVIAGFAFAWGIKVLVIAGFAAFACGGLLWLATVALKGRRRG